MLEYLLKQMQASKECETRQFTILLLHLIAASSHVDKFQCIFVVKK